MIRVALSLALLAATASAAERDAAADGFWTWFVANEARLSAADQTSAGLFDEVGAALRRVDPALTFEFGPIGEARRRFVVSADGIRTAFPSVTRVVAAAPPLARWAIVAFRQRATTLMTIATGGVRVDPAAVHAELLREGAGKSGVRLFVDGMPSGEAAAKAYRCACFLLLDEALGEFDVETGIGVIDVVPGPAPGGALAAADLAAAFDRHRAETAAPVTGADLP